MLPGQWSAHTCIHSALHLKCTRYAGPHWLLICIHSCLQNIKDKLGDTPQVEPGRQDLSVFPEDPSLLSSWSEKFVVGMENGLNYKPMTHSKKSLPDSPEDSEDPQLGRSSKKRPNPTELTDSPGEKKSSRIESEDSPADPASGIKPEHKQKQHKAVTCIICQMPVESSKDAKTRFEYTPRCNKAVPYFNSRDICSTHKCKELPSWSFSRQLCELISIKIFWSP